MSNHSTRARAAHRFRAVLVDLSNAGPVRIEITPKHYGSLSRQAARERTTVAELLRLTALAVLADHLAHPTDTTTQPTPDDRDTPSRV